LESVLSKAIHADGYSDLRGNSDLGRNPARAARRCS
jgi:hypothetical protein